MTKLHQLEDNRPSRETSRDKRSGSQSGRPEGLASTFSTQEVKNLFFSYLTTMLLVEGLIFFFSFINHLAGDGTAFPWKPYLFATFITPIAITFVFGLILLTFNRFFYGRLLDDETDRERIIPVGGWHKGERMGTFLQLIHRLPLLFSMLLLIAVTALAYKLEDILLYLAAAGAVTAKYMFFVLIGVLVALAIGVAVWIFLSYRLRDKTVSADHEYRMTLIEQFGLVQLDDGTVLDRQGQVVHRRESLDERLLSGDLPELEEFKDS